MLINVLVKLKSREQKMEAFGDNRYLVYLNSDTNELANQELLQLVSKKLGSPVGRITLLKGDNSDKKTLEIR